jgi:SAM-dependent methyltransferase
MHEYDLIADWYADQRVDRTGVPEVLALSNAIPPGALVLDVGCGNGIPLTRTLLSEGHRVVGLDTSREMLCRLQRNFPSVPAVRGAAQFSPFRLACFDAAIAWGVLFHLPPPQQVAAIASLSRVLKAGAPFLFTSGDEVDGSRDDFVGVMNGVTFHYYSFTADRYREILAEHGFTLLDTHVDAGKNFYYLARRDR